MIKRFFEWRQRQSPKTKLAIVYLMYVLLLLGINILFDTLWPDEEIKNFRSYLFKSFGTAIIWTLFFDFDKVRAAFKEARHERI